MLTKASELESVWVQHEQKSLHQRELEAMPTTFGDKPLTVLTHSKAPPDPDFTASQNAAIEKAWAEGDDRLARPSSRGANTVIPDSGHYIMVDQPKAVIDAVLKVVDDVHHSAAAKPN
jgi:pimeloyl-ACP methyl ester carboxylesterase